MSKKVTKKNKTPKKKLEKINSEKEICWTAFEPKTQKRFICVIDGIPSYILYSVERPKFVIKKTLFGGKKTEWLPIKLESYDPIVPSGAQSFMDKVESNKPFDIIIRVLNPVGEVVEEWVLVNAEIINLDFGKLDWKDSGEPADIKATVKYEYATLNY